MSSVPIKCCICGVDMIYSQSRMCIACLQSRVSITDSLPKEVTLSQCKHCNRYKRPPWVAAELESQELMQVCLSRLNSLKNYKVTDVGFIWTEPHSRRIKLRVKIQVDVEGTLLEQDGVVTFVVVDLQCPDCKKSFTPHLWESRVQVRQKVAHKRTFFHLEQLIMQNKAQKDCIGIKQKPNGLDFHFSKKSHAFKLVTFIRGVVPALMKESKELISQDVRSNTCNYKYSYLLDILPVCKDDLIVLPFPVMNSRIYVCYKVSSQLHLIDPRNLRTTEIGIGHNRKQSFVSYASKDQLTEFIVLDMEEREDQPDSPFLKLEVEVARADDETFGEVTYRVRTHLGRILDVGESVLGYDFTRMNDDGQLGNKGELPDVFLVKKKPQKRVKKKTKRIADLPDDQEYQKFIEDYDEDIQPEIE